MENMPVFWCSISYMTVYILFSKLKYSQIFQFSLSLFSFKKSHQISRSIPFIIHAKKLTYKNSTCIQCKLYSSKNLVETIFRSKRESKVGVYQVVCLKLKSFKRSLHCPQAILRAV